MEKAGLKTFVYSFVFSLFTVFSVNGIYLRAHSHNRSDIKIPSKNITLFLRDLSQTPENISAAPAKKIVLSVLPEIQTPEKQIIDKIPLAVDDFLEQHSEFQTVASQQIPLQSAQKTADSEVRKPEKVISNFEKVIQSPPPVDENTLKLRETSPENTAAPFIEQDLPEQEPLYVPQNSLHIAAQTPAQKESPPTPSNNELLLVAKDIPHKIKPDEQHKSDPVLPLLIPLEKEQRHRNLATNEIKTAQDVRENQVALNAKNVPIKSMVDVEKSNGIVKNEKSDQWQSMAEKQAQKKDDSPWLVAKGVKFPRNEMVLEDKAYLQDEDEIRRILTGDKTSIAEGKDGVKLASETVKNILIPIPEDILKEKNITPQLVSSNKNQKVEEEMAAKEALRQEQREEEFENQPETAISEQSAEKKGGILNSITSIFSSKKDVPQIGDSVENPSEEQNSLLSAFTRKKSRSFSKILPTEIRLSFQPNRAEISGQTLKWIRAFAQKTVEEPTTGLEIRIDGTSSPLLQRRRLNLLQNILINEGANYNKINTVFTAREPNSFILRTVRINNDNMDAPQNLNNQTNSRYMQW